MTQLGVRVPPQPPFSAMRQRVAALAASGVDGFWWPDHLMAFAAPDLWAEGERTLAEIHTYVDPFVGIAACAELAPRSMMGLCVTDAVRRMPAALAQAALSLDHLAPGRVVLGLGAGEPANFEPYGWRVPSMAARFEEAAEEIRWFFDHGEADHRGAIVGIRPAPGSAGPQLWLAAHGPRGLEATGRFADGWMPLYLPPDEYAAAADRVRGAAEMAGRDPDTITMALSLSAVIQETHEAAHLVLHHPALRAFGLVLPASRFRAAGFEHPLTGDGLHVLRPTLMPGLRTAAEAVPFEILHDFLPHGTPEEVAATLLRFGAEHVKISDSSGAAGPDWATNSIGNLTRVAELLHAAR